MVYCIKSCGGPREASVLHQPLLIALTGNKLHPYLVVTSVGSFPGCSRYLEFVDSSYVTNSLGWKWGGLELFMFVREEACHWEISRDPPPSPFQLPAFARKVRNGAVVPLLCIFCASVINFICFLARNSRQLHSG